MNTAHASMITKVATQRPFDDCDPSATEATAIELLGERRYEEALTLLESAVRQESCARLRALLGTTLFLMERYEDARRVLDAVVQTNGGHPEYREQLEHAIANVAGQAATVDLPGPPFDRDALLAPPSDAELPAVPAQTEQARSAAPLRTGIERLSGAVARALSRASMPLVRALGASDDVWTNWYRRPVFLALVQLNYMREQLATHNRKDCYPAGELSGFQSRGLEPPSEAEHFRTPDGTWNNLSNPKEGAAGVRFPRNVRRAATWPKRDLLSPNPAEISHELFTRSDNGMKEVPFLNLLAASWIQFMLHDWVSHRISPARPGAYEIPLPLDHYARKAFHQTKLLVGRTVDDPTRMPLERESPPTYINEVTSWWDGSQIYGSDAETARSLRALSSGKLRLDGEQLPVGADDLVQTGFSRNWWLGLSLLHTLFVREHNAICDMLQLSHPNWDDARIYNVARLINAAVMAKIHTVEWTPAILPNRVLNLAMNANWFGLIETILHKRPDRRVFRGLKIESHALGGIVGNFLENHGVPYGLSEEFTEVYRLHELLPDELQLRRIGDPRALEQVALAATRHGAARALTQRIAMSDLFYSFGKQHPGQLVLNNYPRTLQRLSIPGNPVYDLGAVDVLRARERGVPRYNEFRRQLGLNPIRYFEDLTDDPTQLASLKRIYANDVEAIDLLVGTRAESHRPTGYGFGETMFQIFILNASLRLQADRFYTTSFNAETYTKEGIEWIDRADFRSVLLRHYPELIKTGLKNVTNAFEPWDTGELDLGRHPLRAFA